MAAIKKAQLGSLIKKGVKKVTSEIIPVAEKNLTRTDASYNKKGLSMAIERRVNPEAAKKKMTKAQRRSFEVDDSYRKNGGPINKAQSGKYVVNWTDKTPAPVTRSPTSGLTPEQKTRIKEWVPGSKISNGKVTPPKAKNGMWMQKAAASIKKRGTEGKCTPITKPGCTGKAKTLAKTFKKIANKKK